MNRLRFSVLLVSMPLLLQLKGTLLRWIAYAPEALAALEFRELIRKGMVTVGRHTYGRPRIRAYRGSERRVSIGSFCSISPGVEIITGGVHPADWVSLYPFRIKWGLKGAYQDGMPTSRGDVEIGSDVWLGTGVLILSGVKIGHGTVVAARSVVTRDIPPYSVAAGIPARVVRKRFSEDQIQCLLKISWWDWPEERIQEAVPWLSSSRIDEFLARYGAH